MKQSKEQTLRLIVRDKLLGQKERTRAAAPAIWAMIQSPEGYRKAEDMIIRYALTNSVGIGAAIGLLESELAGS